MSYGYSFTTDVMADRIKANNEAFAKANKFDKRVLIAEDVLKAIKTKKIHPQNGVYLDGSYDKIRHTEDRNTDLGEVLQGEACNVCAVGALFVCAVRRLDALKLKDLAMSTGPKVFEMRRYLIASGAFTEQQTHVVERAFEGSWALGSRGLYDGDSTLRMQRVMQALIINKGRIKYDRATFKRVVASEKRAAKKKAA